MKHLQRSTHLALDINEKRLPCKARGMPVAAEMALDGTYTVRVSMPPPEMRSFDVELDYKGLRGFTPAFVRRHE
jgi:hypothetical protein